MPTVLICAPDPLTDELHRTLLWRDGIERHVAGSFEDALTISLAARPDLVVVDRDLPRALRLVEDLRADPATRGLSIVVASRGDFETGDLPFLEAGANAVLRLPAGPEWDDRLGELMRVPARKRTRLRVRLEFQGRASRVETVWGLVADVSVSGMLVETPADLAIGADLDFRLRLPGDPDDLAGTGHVVREAGPGRYGVRFYGLEGDGAERVRRFVGGSMRP